MYLLYIVIFLLFLRYFLKNFSLFSLICLLLLFIVYCLLFYTQLNKLTGYYFIIQLNSYFYYRSGEFIFTNHFLLWFMKNNPNYFRLKEAILARNFEAFAHIIMKDSNQLHAVCMDTYPPIKVRITSSVSQKIQNCFIIVVLIIYQIPRFFS